MLHFVYVYLVWVTVLSYALLKHFIESIKFLSMED